MNCNRYLLLWLWLWLPATQVLAGDGQDLLRRFLENTQTMQAQFRQTLKSSDGVLLQESDGDFYLQRPRKFRWNYNGPFEQQIVSDGDNVWIYDVELQQVTLSRADKGGSGTPMALLDSMESLNASFEVFDRGDVDGIHRVELVAKSDDVDFRRAMIGFSTDALHYLELFDQFEQTTLILFSDIRPNATLDAALFDFKPPAGVDVFGGR